MTNYNKSPYLKMFFAILFVLFIFFVINRQSIDSSVSKQMNKDTDNNADQSLPEVAGDTQGYIDYSDQAFENSKDKRRVLYFYANWCTTCIPVNADFIENANKIPEDVVVFKVNFRDSDTDEREKQLAEKYKITHQHTFVQVSYAGGIVTSWNGGNLANLIKNVN